MNTTEKQNRFKAKRQVVNLKCEAKSIDELIERIKAEFDKVENPETVESILFETYALVRFPRVFYMEQ